MRQSRTVTCTKGGGSCREKEIVLEMCGTEAVDLTINEVTRHYSGTLNKAAAAGLRDALIELFPLETNKPALKVGDLVQPTEGNSEYFGNLVLPLRVIEIAPATTSDGPLYKTRDGWGKQPAQAFGFRLEAYAPKSQQGMGTVSDSPAKWEVVADGLDRIKVPGGWIYQSVDGVQTFVPEPK